MTQAWILTGVPCGVLLNSQRACASGILTQPLLRGTPKDYPTFSCQGAAWRQIISLELTHIV